MQVCSLAQTKGRGILAATILASGTILLQSTTVSVALPQIQSYFGSAVSGIQWVSNANTLVLASLILIGGSLGDFFGRKRIYNVGLILLGLACIAAGFSLSLIQLILMQAVIGIAAAITVPQSLSILRDCFDPSEQGRAIGLWAGLSGLITLPGPWIGGWLVETFSWRAVYFLPVPFVVVTLIFAAFYLPAAPPTRENRFRIDWVGALLVFLGLLGIAYGLISGPSDGWLKPLTMATLVVGPVLLIAFILYEKRHDHPLIPFKMFESPYVTGANVCTIFLYFAFNGLMFFLILNLQQAQGFSPSNAGLGILPPLLIITFFTGSTGSLADRIGPRLPMILGPALVTAGLVWLVVSGGQANYWLEFLPGLLLTGIGMAVVIPPLTKSALAVPPSFSGAASGVNNAMARIAALLAVAVLGVVILTAFKIDLQNRLAISTLSPPQQSVLLDQSTRLGAVVVPTSFSLAAQTESRAIVRESFIFAFRWTMAVCALMALLAALASYLLIHNQPPGPIRVSTDRPG